MDDRHCIRTQSNATQLQLHFFRRSKPTLFVHDQHPTARRTDNKHIHIAKPFVDDQHPSTTVSTSKALAEDELAVDIAGRRQHSLIVIDVGRFDEEFGGPILGRSVACGPIE